MSLDREDILMKNNLKRLGYDEKEVLNLINNSKVKYENNLHNFTSVDVNIDDLTEHVKMSEEFNKYPKSTISFLINEYNKKKLNIQIGNEFVDYLQSNIESVDQELWVKDNVFMTAIDDQSSLQIYEFENLTTKTEENSIVSLSKLNLDIKTKKQDYRNLIAGFLSSMISRTIGAPLDRLKMLYQVNYVGNKETPSIKKGLTDIYRKDGFKGYFKGNLINIVKSAPENGIKLYIFELSKWKLQCHYGERLSTSQLFLSGSISGIVSVISIFPLEVLKLRIATAEKGVYNGYFDAIRKIYQEPKGLLNFYSGIEASIISVIPNAGLNLTVYEILKIFFSGKRTIDNGSYLSTSTLMFIGGLSALISSTVLYPFQIVQARMIMYNLKQKYYDYSNINNKYFSKFKFTKCIYSTYTKEGFRGFFKGYVPGITKIVIGNSLNFAMYENIKKLLKVNND